MNIRDKKSVKIGYQQYEFDFWPDTFSSTEDAEGEFFAKDKKIGLKSSTLDSIYGANTVIHEIMHGIAYQYGMLKTLDKVNDGEEKIVNTMTNGLMTVFVDNPWLLDYLKDTIENERLGIDFNGKTN